MWIHEIVQSTLLQWLVLLAVKAVALRNQYVQSYITVYTVGPHYRLCTLATVYTVGPHYRLCTLATVYTASYSVHSGTTL